jgi:hypothetical protein
MTKSIRKQGGEISGCIQGFCGYYIKQDILMMLCLQGQGFLPSPTIPRQCGLIFVVRPPEGWTAGKKRHILFVSISAKRWFCLQEDKIYDGSILINFPTIPELFV